MTEHMDGEHCAGIVDCDQQLDRPAVPVRRHRQQHRSHGLALPSRPVHRHGLRSAQLVRRADEDPVVERVVVE